MSPDAVGQPVNPPPWRRPRLQEQSGVRARVHLDVCKSVRARVHLNVCNSVLTVPLPVLARLFYGSEKLTSCQTKMVGRTSDRRVLVGTVLSGKRKGGVARSLGEPLAQCQGSPRCHRALRGHLVCLLRQRHHPQEQASSH